MAIVLVEGFDAYNSVSNSTAGSTASGNWIWGGDGCSLVAGRYGGQALFKVGSASSGDSGTGYNLYNTFGSITQGCLGFAFRTSIFPTNTSTCFLYLTTANLASQLALRVGPSGELVVARTNGGVNGSIGTILGTTANNVIALGAWNYIEMEFVISDTVGVINLYVNGQSLLSLSGVDTKTNATLSTVTTVYLGDNTSNVGKGSYTFDDMYITDTPTRLGEQRIETLYPSADTAQLQWTTKGENFSLGPGTSASTTAFATKGDIFTCTANVTLNSVTSYFGAVAQSVKLGVARLTSTNPGTVAEILYESSVVNLGATAMNSTFSVPNIAFTSGNVYGIYFTRTDGDGTSILSIASVNTIAPITSDQAGTLIWNAPARAADNNIGVSDSIYFASNTYVIMTLGLAGFTANNYALLDSTLLTSNAFISSNTVGNYDLYDFTNLSSTPTSISAVTVNALAQKDNVATRAVATTVKSGSSTTDGSNVYLGGGFNVSSRILDTDPNTNSAWTANAVNAIQAGVKVTI